MLQALLAFSFVGTIALVNKDASTWKIIGMSIIYLTCFEYYIKKIVKESKNEIIEEVIEEMENR